MKKIIFLIFLSLLVIQRVSGNEGYRIDSNETKEIDKHNICKQVKNNTGNPYFIPVKTSNEWTTFRSNLPNGIDLSECYTYEWQISSWSNCSANAYWGNWGGCDVSCGRGYKYRNCNGSQWGTQTRDVYCKRNDGKRVDDNYCSGNGNKPDDNISCYNGCDGSSRDSCYAGSCAPPPCGSFEKRNRSGNCERIKECNYHSGGHYSSLQVVGRGIGISDGSGYYEFIKVTSCNNGYSPSSGCSSGMSGPIIGPYTGPGLYWDSSCSYYYGNY